MRLRSLLLGVTAFAAATALPGSGMAQECRKLEEGECPTFYQVRAQSRPGPALDILVLPDGFKKEDLDQFRCAVTKMVDGLLGIELFKAYACRLNIYRMDVAAPDGGGIKAGSGCLGCRPAETAPYEKWRCAEIARGTRIRSGQGPACAIADLETQLCADGGNCNLLLASTAGQERILDLRKCFIDTIKRRPTVLVLANSSTYGGGVPRAGQFAFSTLPYIAATETEPHLSKRQWGLLGHELGHAMLWLNDEYVGRRNRDCPLKSGMNIVAGEEMEGRGWPWLARCNPQPCQVVCASNPACRPGERCANGQPCCTGSGELSAGFVGLVEGACYNDCGFYRAAQDCIMDDLDRPFCPGCIAATAARLGKAGIPACP